MYFFGGKVLVLSALARAMSKDGYRVHVSHVSRVFRGERPATKDFVSALARVIGVTEREAKRMIDQAIEASHKVDLMPKLVEE